MLNQRSMYTKSKTVLRTNPPQKFMKNYGKKPLNEKNSTISFSYELG